MIPYGRQSISDKDISAVIDVLRSDFLTQGPQIPLFEQKYAAYVEASYGIATNSATSALHLACLAIGLGAGDHLWTSPNTFLASANCALYCGAKVDFVDIDPETYNLSVDQLEEKLEKAKNSGELPKVVVAVHFAGQSCDMERIFGLSKIYGFHIIEDASHAIGSRYNGLPVGCCKYSDITVFSFHPVKIVTTAEGGLLTTNSSELAEKLLSLRSHGVTRDPGHMTKNADGDWYYQQVDLGFNYRMTELQAALGITQMERLDSFVQRRHELASRYDLLLEKLPLKIPFQNRNCYSSFHLYPVQIEKNRAEKGRKEIFDQLRKLGVGVNVHYIPVHTQPYYLNMGFSYGDFPVSESYYENALSLPIFQDLSFEQQDYIVECLINILGVKF